MNLKTDNIEKILLMKIGKGKSLGDGRVNRIILLMIVGILILPVYYSNLGVVSADSSFYVANNGDNSNDGLSPSTPWRTIAKVNSEWGGAISQGDDIYFKGGDTFNDAQLNLWATGGTASDFMTIGSYGTGRAIFSFSGSGAIIKCTTAVDHVRIENLELTGSPSGTYGIDFDNNCGASDIEIINIYAHDTAYTPIMIRDTNGYKIENCISRPNSASYHGISIGVGATNGIIRNCTISNTKDGINFHFRGPAQSQGPVGDNHLIEDCTITSARSDEESIDLVGGDGCDNVMVRNCSITSSGGASFHVGHGTDQVFVDGCYMYSQKGMYVTSDPVDVTFRNCIAYSWTTDGGIMKSSTGGTTERATIYNCDFVATGSGQVHMEIKNSAVNGWVVKNCIFSSTVSSSPSRYFDTDGVTLAGAGADFSYNMWWRGDGLTGSAWQVDTTNYNWAGWLAFAQVSNDLRDDPELVDPANGDFSLKDTSPCIDAGGWLTTTNGGGTGSTITIDDAGYFFPGFTDIGSRDEDVAGDNIFVGDDTNLQVTAVNYASNTITVDRSISWNDGEVVSLSSYSGSAPDIGAREFVPSGPDTTPPQISNVILIESNPLDTDPSFGWVNITCDVTDNSAVDEVFLNITKPDGSYNNVSMISGSLNSYYYLSSTMCSAYGNYSYFIWADDINSNPSTSTLHDFSMPPNWDINNDGECNVLDLNLISNHMYETGQNGWIREDVDNNGEVNVLDFVLSTNYYGQSWWT